MINVNKITATLAKMPDVQLQQYAQMHKADPYIMALAMSESNRRKELRAASQAPAQGEQPKVVDQMVAEMAPPQLPEDQGIGQIPAGDMNFAGGGIIAFADGGGVERYNGNSGSWVDNFLYSNTTPAEQARRKRIQEEAEANRLPTPYERERVANMASVAAGKSYRPEDYGVTAAAPAFQDPRLIGATPIDATGGAAAQPLDKGADKTVVTKKAPPATGSGANTAGAAKTSAGLPGLTDLTTLRQSILDKQDFKDPAAAQLLELEARERAAAAAEKQAIERDAERFKDAYKGREARLAEREADIGKQKESNTGLAFLNAGLAIMSTPGGLASAIGKGARVGTEQFAAGLDKIRSAQERLSEAKDRLDDLKLNREESTAKEIRAAENNYRRVGIDAQKRTIDGIRMAADVNQKTASEIYGKTVDLTKTMYEQQQENARNAARISASRNSQLELLQAVQKDPALADAYRALHGKGVDVMGEYNDFLKANPMLAADPKAAMTQFLMTKSVFSQLGGGTVTDKPSTKLRTQP